MQQQLSSRRRCMLGGGIVVIIALVATVLAVLYHPESHPAAKHGSSSSSSSTTPTSASSSSLSDQPSLDPIETDKTSDAPPDTSTVVVAQNATSKTSPELTFSSPSSTTKQNAPSLVASTIEGLKTGGAKDGDGSTCWAQDAEELRHAVEDSSCSVVMVTNPDDAAYELNEEITVSRRVTIQGNALTLPYINCEEAVRCFRVKSTGFLELRYVAIAGGRGITRSRFLADDGRISGTPRGFASTVVEVRGGCVFIEPGALGGTFVGVYFDNDESGPEAVAGVIEEIVTGTAVRAYGGAILMAGGVLNVIGCFFRDFEVLSPFDVMCIGGSILVLAGEANFVGCTWLYTVFIGFENGAGFSNAILGGVSTYSFCHFIETSMSVAMNGIGETFFVGGGVQILTGVAFTYANVALFFAGAGEICTVAGLQIVTGANLFDTTVFLALFGAGFNYIVGAGLLVHTGTALHVYTGPMATAAVGGYSFVGAGNFIATGAVAVTASSVSWTAGIGSVHYVGSGLGVFIGCPCIAYGGVSSEDMVGAYVGLSAGFMVWLGGPLIGISAIDYYIGLGSSLWVGIGALVIGYTPVVGYVALQGQVRDIWVGGTCEPYAGAWEPGNPIFVVPGGICNNSARMLESEISPSLPSQQSLMLDSSSSSSSSSMDTSTILSKSISEVKKIKVGLLAFNVTKNDLNLNDQAMVDSIANIVPSSFLDAAKVMDDSLATFRANRKPSPPLSIQIDSQVDGYCGVCGIERESLSGAGAESCEQSSSCSSSKDFNPPAGTESLMDWNTVDFKEHYVILGDLESTSSNSSGFANTTKTRQAADLQDALKYALTTEGGGSIEDSLLGLQLTMWDAEPDEMFADIFPPPTPSRHLTEDFDVTHRFKFAVVTTAKAISDAVIGEVGGNSSSSSSSGVNSSTAAAADKGGEGYQVTGLEQRMRAYLMSEKDTELGHLGLSYDRFIHIPAYNSDMLSQKNPVTSLGAYSIVLADPSQPAVPLTHVEYMKSYSIHCELFTPRNRVILQLMGRPEELSSQGDVEEYSKQIGTVLTDENGNVQWTYRFKLIDAPPGDYYLKATDVQTGSIGLSPLYTLSQQTRKRTLYGPLWEI